MKQPLLIVCCPNCGDDLIAGKTDDDQPCWWCQCNYCDGVTPEQKQMWEEAYARNGWQR